MLGHRGTLHLDSEAVGGHQCGFHLEHQRRGFGPSGCVRVDLEHAVLAIRHGAFHVADWFSTNLRVDHERAHSTSGSRVRVHPVGHQRLERVENVALYCHITAPPKRFDSESNMAA